MQSPYQFPTVAMINKKFLIGTWHILQMEQWDRDYLDMEQPAQLRLTSDDLGELTFGAIHATVDWRLAGHRIDFTFAGFDDDTEVSGRGYADISEAATMAGRIFFHLGDESGFDVAKKLR